MAKSSHGFGLALLHAEGDTTTVFVDLEDHDFDFVAELDNLGRVDVLVGPVHFGHVHQAFDALLDFNEGAVVGDVGDLAEQAGALRVTAGRCQPTDRRPAASGPGRRGSSRGRT